MCWQFTIKQQAFVAIYSMSPNALRDEGPEPEALPGFARIEYSNKPVPVRDKITKCPCAK
jgi:hypothetical protein